MYGFMIVVHVLASIFLIAVILFQAGRGGGLTEGLGGGAMQNIFGASSKTVLTKVTTVCAIIFICTSLLLTILTTRRSKSLIDLEKSKVIDITTKQRPGFAKTQASQTTASVGQQQAQSQTAGQDSAKTVTVREVKIDPATGKEIVVKEEKMTPQEAAAKGKQQQIPAAVSPVEATQPK